MLSLQANTVRQLKLQSHVIHPEPVCPDNDDSVNAKLLLYLCCCLIVRHTYSQPAFLLQLHLKALTSSLYELKHEHELKKLKGLNLDFTERPSTTQGQRLSNPAGPALLDIMLYCCKHVRKFAI